MKKTTGLLIALSMLVAAMASCQHLELPSHGEPKVEKDLDLQMVKISRDSLFLPQDFSFALKAYLYPDNAKAQEIVWSSLDDKIASVNDTGLVKAIGIGEGKILATSPETNLTDTCIVVVSKFIHVSAVKLDQSAADVYLGSTLELVATVEPEDATVKDVAWSSSDESVATVDEKGVVTPVKEGKTTITVTTVESSKTATCAVTVKRVEVTGVTLNKTSIELAPGSATTLKATVEPEDATYPEVTWSSSDESVATVDAGGKVTAVAQGTATITVTTVDGGKTATCAVTVKESTGTQIVTLQFDLSKCPASLASVQTKIPNGTYAFVDKNGDSYDFTLKKAATATSAVASYSSKGYLVVNVSDYLGTPVIKNGTLKSFTFVQGAASNGKRKSAMTSETHDDALTADYYDCAEPSYHVSVLTDTQGEAYKFTIVDGVPGKSYYFVCAASGIGLKSIELTYEIEVKREPKELTFDFSSKTALPGWPTADKRTHVDGGITCTYPLGGQDYVFTLADCLGADSDRVYWHSSGYIILAAQYRYFGMPALEGYKLTKVIATHATTAKERMVGIAKQIEATATHPDAAGGHGYVVGGEPQNFNEQYHDYTFNLEETEANKVYYIYQKTSGSGISKLVLTYMPE